MILHRYIHREIAGKAGWIIGFMVLLMAGRQLARYLADAAAGLLPAELLLRALLMKMLVTLPTLLPLALFLAIMLSLARLARDGELTMMSLAGGIQRAPLAAVVQFSLGFSLLVLLMAFFASPWASRNMETLRALAQAEMSLSNLQAGEFNEFDKGRRVLYVERIEAGAEQVKNVFLQTREGRRLHTLSAAAARYQSPAQADGRYLRFDQGRQYSSYPDGAGQQATRYGTYAILVKRKVGRIRHLKMESQPLRVLLGSDNPKHRAELQWRLSLAASTLLLSVLAVALGRYSFNRQQYLAAFAGVFAYIIYSNMMSISKTLLKRDELSPIIGLWWTHLALAVLAALIFRLPTISLKQRNRDAAAWWKPRRRRA